MTTQPRPTTAAAPAAPGLQTAPREDAPSPADEAARAIEDARRRLAAAADDVASGEGERIAPARAACSERGDRGPAAAGSHRPERAAGRRMEVAARSRSGADLRALWVGRRGPDARRPAP